MIADENMWPDRHKMKRCMKSMLLCIMFDLLVFVIEANGKWEDCPNSCRMNRKLNRRCRYHAKHVVCPRRSWFQLRMIGSEVVTLSLRDNNIRRLDPQVMRRFYKLKYLDISNNKIRSLRRSLSNNLNLLRVNICNNELGRSTSAYSWPLASAFKRNKKLRTIQIRENDLTRLPPTMMGRRNNLKSLDVSNNLISIIGRHTFRLMGALEQLFINHNQIKFVHKHAFIRNRKLRHMNMESNYISFIQYNKPLHLRSNLRFLLISNNRVETLKEINLSESNQLERLDASLNKVKEIKQYDIDHNGKLLQLNLSYNYIKKIHPASFQQQRYLQTLDLTGNALHYIDPTTLKSLKHVSTISLAHNYLVHIEDELLSDNIRLRSLDLRNNHWILESDNIWNSFKSNNVLTTGQNSINYNGHHSGRWRYVLKRLKCLMISAETSDTEQLLSSGGLMKCATNQEANIITWICGCNQSQANT